MNERPARKSRAERKPTDDQSVVVWIPEGAPVLTSPGVEARTIRGGTTPQPSPSRTITTAQASHPAPATSKPVPPPPKSPPPRSESREGRPAYTPSAHRPPAPAPRRTAAAAPVASTEQLPVTHLPGDWGIPDAWDLPPEAVTALGPDGEVPIPPQVDAAAAAVMKAYDMSVSSIALITSKPDKGGAIWRIETNHGPRSLKLLHRYARRSLFSIGAQEYLVGQGARVPALVRTRDGGLCVQTGAKLWIVTDWIEPLVPATKVDLDGAAALCYGLGEFHRLSQGYVEPRGAYHASRLHRWPKAYRKILSKIGWFREVARAYSELPAAQTLLSVVDIFEQQALDAIARLDASGYAALAGRGEQAHGIVHQDYGWSNGQMGPGGIWIIDLDGVAFDLGIRDLRKLITSTMDDMGVWDVNWMRGMIDAYNQANPIEPDLLQVLLIDMSLPNEFYKHVKEIVLDPTMNLNAELEALLQRLMQIEPSKWQALRELGLMPAPAGEGGRGR